MCFQPVALRTETDIVSELLRPFEYWTRDKVQRLNNSGDLGEHRERFLRWVLYTMYEIRSQNFLS
jgi:hypothetical protein